MAESNFSWFKAASFTGAVVLAVICFVVIAAGINLISNEQDFPGIMCILAGLLSGGRAVMVYKNYQKKSKL